jgi:hypothetical protein
LAKHPATCTVPTWLKRHRRDANLKIFGVAGEQLQQTDFEALFNVSKLTGMGLVELGNVKNIAWRISFCGVRSNREGGFAHPDRFPDFNLRLAHCQIVTHSCALLRESADLGVARGRFTRSPNRLIGWRWCFLEVDFYRRHGVNVTFVGHPC